MLYLKSAPRPNPTLLLMSLCGLCLLAPRDTSAQACWWDPAAPLVGQDLEIFYDVNAGTLPPGAEDLILHWGVYDPETTFWSLPPEANWPWGSIPFEGVALQSPMTEQGGGIWSIVVPSVEPMEHIAWVFTDGESWDSNDGNNWIVSYVSDEVSCWWVPEEPETGDTVTLYYNAVPGTLPDGAAVHLHWGINEFGHGNWQLPPEEMWPAGTEAQGIAARTPMVDEGAGIWSLSITPVDTVRSLHWVFTDGDNWDNNNGENWDLYFGDTPVLYEVPLRFVFDPRSAFYAGPAQISQVTLAGDFNGWNMSSHPLEETASGPWFIDHVLEEGYYEYKFVVNGENWTWDPDNPETNPEDNNNSIVNVVAGGIPRLKDFSLPWGLVVDAPVSMELEAEYYPPDTGEEIDWASAEVQVNGEPEAFTVLENTLTVTLDFGLEGPLTVELSVPDTEGDTSHDQWRGGYFDGGYHALDALGDDDGGGSYEYPTPFDGYCDIEALRLEQAAEGDTLRLAAELGLLHDYSKLAFLVLPDAGSLPEGDHIREELDSPDWAGGSGVFLSLMRPGAPSLDPEQDNRLVYDDDPFLAGPAVTVWEEGNTLLANLPMDLLEQRLGGWAEAWYFGAWAMIDGVAPIDGGVMEVGEDLGGVEEAYDPDVYDFVFCDTPFLEDRMLRNFSLGRTATLDAAGRGLAEVWPEMVGPDMGAPGPRVRILTQGAATVLTQKTIAGTVSEDAVGDVLLLHGYGEEQTDSLWITPGEGEWSLSLSLQEGANAFQALAVDVEEEWGTSSTLTYTLLVNHAPQPAVDLSWNGEWLSLNGSATLDIDGDITGWLWEMEEGNPETVEITNSESMIARIYDLPATDGSYWLRLTVEDEEGHEDHARGLFEIENGELHLVADDGYPLWVRDAVIYEIYVRSFDAQRDLAAITARMAEIADLEVNTLWLMPIFEGPSDHGYAVSDYYSIEADYGSLEDFRDFVEAAHAQGLRVVLDMVINHCSIDHPWMLSALTWGEYAQSHGYFMWNPDGTHQYYYDWWSLPNLNVSNADLRHEVYEMCRYWVEDEGVDGYRCDVAWGPMDRDPSYWTDWRDEIRRKRPDLLLLAESGATSFDIFEDRFNLAYDWEFFWNALDNLDTVSPSTVQDRVSNFGFWFPENALPFRFTENHDESRFITAHGLEQSRLAAALVFAVPGTPLIYAGQEVGETSQRGLIDWSDPHDLRPFYKRLCQIRNGFRALRDDRADQLASDQSSQLYSIARRTDDPAGEGVVLAAFNLSQTGRSAVLQLDPAEWGMEQGFWYLTDLFTGEVTEYPQGVPGELALDFEGWEPRYLLLADEAAEVGVGPVAPEQPWRFSLGPAYPNPFNPSTTIPFSLPAGDPRVELKAYNLLGQEVARIFEGPAAAGEHRLHWDASGLASGVYVLRLGTSSQSGGALTSKVLLLK